MVTMGYSCDPLDVCFGDQLAGSVTLRTCIGIGTHFHLDSPIENLGHSWKFFELVE